MLSSRYELYDLVALHNNEAAVVVAVGTEKLAVVNLSDERKELLPPELQGCVGAFSLLAVPLMLLLLLLFLRYVSL